ncbi:MAG: nucleoside-diphosphate kinase [candidate division WOR-3 bacterium]
MIKPDAVAMGVVGQIISRLESMGFMILRMEMKPKGKNTIFFTAKL